MHEIVAKLRPVVMIFLGFLFLLQVGASRAAGPVLDRVVESGVLRVAMSVDQPPFTMRSRDKKVIGFDVDLARALAGTMQVQLEIVELPFGELLAALEEGKADLVISGLSITAERSRQVSFVGPYLLSGKSILTTSRIKSVVKDSSDFNDPEIRLVALKNSTSESFVQRQMPEASLHAIANYNEGIQMLLTGSVDAMVADVPILKLSMLRYPDAGMGIVEPQLSVEPLGIALAMGDIQFENLLRNYLLAFDKAGLIPRLQQKWLEDNSWMVYLP